MELYDRFKMHAEMTGDGLQSKEFEHEDHLLCVTWETVSRHYREHRPLGKEDMRDDVKTHVLDAVLHFPDEGCKDVTSELQDYIK